MNTVSVWAPYAKSLELQSRAGRTAMVPIENGWWQSTEELEHGEDYGFFVDKEGPFPDPRSRWQPNGVHSLSRNFQISYPWTDSTWRAKPAAQAVIYELHTGTFTEKGTFQGILDRLDHLSELGITHVEILPIAAFDGTRGWGYDGVQLFAPHPAYGDPTDLMALVDHCHKKGIGVILDVVYNHLGPSGNYLSKFAPYFHSHYHTPWGEAVNMDGFDSPEVRRYFIDNALMWLKEFHFDGLRLDAVQTIMDGSSIHFLEELANEVQTLEQDLDRPLILIAESHMNDRRLMLPQEQNGYGLQAQWHDDFHHAVYTCMKEENAGYFQDYGNLEDLAKVLNEGVFFDGNYCQYRRRNLGRPAVGLDGTNFVAYIQNHDQVGNRPGGERLSHVLNLGQMKIAATLLLTSPFIPMLFQGEEWGADTPFYFFTDHQESSLGQAVRKGRKKEAEEFGWPLTHFSDPQKPHSFEQSCLNWEEKNQSEKQAIHTWYKALLTLRNQYSDLQCGPFLQSEGCHGARVIQEQSILTYSRGAFFVACNFSAQDQSLELDSGNEKGLALQSDEKITASKTHLNLTPYSVAILLSS